MVRVPVHGLFPPSLQESAHHLVPSGQAESQHGGMRYGVSE